MSYEEEDACEQAVEGLRHCVQQVKSSLGFDASQVLGAPCMIPHMTHMYPHTHSA